MSPRVPGHGLLLEGACHDDNGKAVVHLFSFERAGSGRAKCECGQMSERLPSGNARKRWHREHRSLIVQRRQEA